MPILYAASLVMISWLTLQAYEKERMEEQLDDIADWLDSCNAPSLIKRVTGTKRIRIAIMQSWSLDRLNNEQTAELMPRHLRSSS